MTSLTPQRPRVVTSSAYLAVPTDSGRSLSASPTSSPETSPLISSAPPQWTIPYRPPVSRPNSHARSISQSLASPIPTPPYLMSQGSALSASQPRRLLMPTVRSARQYPTYCSPLKTPLSAKASPAKLGRSRAASGGEVATKRLKYPAFRKCSRVQVFDRCVVVSLLCLRRPRVYYPFAMSQVKESLRPTV